MFVFLLNIALMAIALVDCLGRDEPPRRLPRPLWTVIILAVFLAGPIAWFVAGRPRPGLAAPHAPRPIAPDDDPEFLASLDRMRLRGAGGLSPQPEPRQRRSDSTKNSAREDNHPRRESGADGSSPRNSAREGAEHPPDDGPEA